MDGLISALFYALAAGLCSILVALFVILRLRGRVLWQAVKNLAGALTPFALALVIWSLIRWPSHQLWDHIMIISVFVFVLVGIGKLIIFTVRCIRLH